MTALTDKTKYFYDSYPFPQLDDATILKNSQMENSRLVSRGIPSDLLEGNIKVLDAGCGTGSFSLSFALAHPKSEVTSINLNQASLEYAKNQAQSLGIKNINFEKMDIFNLSADFLKKKFHLVHCSGVLHHTMDPNKGLNIISDLVMSKHYLITGLYHKGRYKVRAMRIILKLLAGNNNEKRIRLARKLFPTHCYNHFTKGFGNAKRSKELEDIALADKFVVPKESYHSFTKTNIILSSLGFLNLYKNVSAPNQRTRRERWIHKFINILPFSKNIKSDLADDLIALISCKEMLSLTSRKID